MHPRTLLVLPLLLPALGQADTTLTYTSATHPDAATIIQVKDGDVLMGDQRSKLLFKEGKQEIVIIDHLSRTFMVMDEAAAKRLEQQMGSMQQQMNAMMEQMQKQMENMSEEERAQIEKMMGDRMPGAQRKPAKTTVEHQGEDTVAGVTCSQMMVLVNGKPTGDVCVATAGVLSVDTKDYKAMVNATDTIKKVMERMIGKVDNDAVTMNFRAMKGIPVRMRDLRDGDVSTLESRSSADLDAATFRVPEGYRKQDMFQ